MSEVILYGVCIEVNFLIVLCREVVLFHTK